MWCLARLSSPKEFFLREKHPSPQPQGFREINPPPPVPSCPRAGKHFVFFFPFSVNSRQIYPEKRSPRKSNVSRRRLFWKPLFPFVFHGARKISVLAYSTQAVCPPPRVQGSWKDGLPPVVHSLNYGNAAASSLFVPPFLVRERNGLRPPPSLRLKSSSLTSGWPSAIPFSFFFFLESCGFFCFPPPP